MGSAEPEPVTMRAFIIVALAAAVHGDAKPYTVGQVLAGATNGGVITSTTYHGGLKVAGFPHAAVVPALGYAAPVVYGKREAEAQFFQYHNLGAFATTNPVHAVAATPVGLTHSSNVGLCTNFVGAAVPCRYKKSEKLSKPGGRFQIN